MWKLLRLEAFFRRIVSLTSVAPLLIAWSSAWALTDTPPLRTDANLIVAVYNIQWLGQKPHDFDKLAEVIQHFDVCGVVEIKDESALKELTTALETLTGTDWGFSFGLRTHRPRGRYHEAYGALWRKDRVALGDGLTSGVWDRWEEFRNDPYFISFVAGGFDFTMLLVHTRWTDDPEGSREGEVKAIAEHVEHLRSFLDEDDILVGGDFNYSAGSKKMKPLAEQAELIRIDKNDKTTFKADFSDYASPYDHMYVTESFDQYVIGEAEALDVTKLVFGDNSVEHMRRAKSELSDHLPVFVVLNRWPQ